MSLQEESKVYTLIKPERFSDKLPEHGAARTVKLPEGVIQIGGHFHAGREDETHAVINSEVSSETLNPVLREYLGGSQLDIEPDSGIVMPGQPTSSSLRRSGDISSRERELSRARDQSKSVLERSQILNEEIQKAKADLIRDLESQKMLISGTERSIRDLREEMEDQGMISAVSSTMNLFYAAGHHVSKWADWGIFEEEPITLSQQNENVISQWEKEIEFRKAKVLEIEGHLRAIESQGENVNQIAAISGPESVRRENLERVIENTLEIVRSTRESSEQVRNLEFQWREKIKEVEKGFQALDNQLANQESILAGVEKGLVIGLAIGGGALVTFATGGAAAPWYMSIVYGVCCGMAASSGQFIGHMACGGDLDMEIQDVKGDFKDSILYSASGALNGAWIGARAVATRAIVGNSARVGVTQSARAITAWGMGGLGNLASGLSSGLRVELIPALYDSFVHDSIDTLDPTGKYREAGVPEWKLRVKNFTQRMASAGTSGAVSHGLSGYRGRWGLEGLTATPGRSMLNRVMQGTRVAAVEASSDVVELGADTLNGLYVQASWIPFLYGLEGESKDGRELTQMISSGIGGSVAGRMNGTLRNQAEARSVNRLQNIARGHERIGAEIENSQGIVAPEVALSASSVPLVLEGDPSRMVASNLGVPHFLLESVSGMHGHRVAGQQAASVDARKGGVVSGVVRNFRNAVQAVGRNRNLNSDTTIIGNQRRDALDTLANSVERRVQALANTNIDDNYVTRLLAERRMRFVPEGRNLLERVMDVPNRILARLDGAANPYGHIRNVDSEIVTRDDVVRTQRANRAAARGKFFDTNVIDLTMAGFGVQLKAGGLNFKLAGRDFGLRFDGSNLHVFRPVADLTRIPQFFSDNVWNSRVVQGVVNSRPVRFVGNLLVDGLGRPALGIGASTTLLPTSGIWWGPGTAVAFTYGGLKLVKDVVFGGIVKNSVSASYQQLFRRVPLIGDSLSFGDSVASGEMLARRAELQLVRDMYATRIGERATPEQRRNLADLNREMGRVETLYNRANRVGIVGRSFYWLGGKRDGGNGLIIDADTRADLDFLTNRAFDGALARRQLARETVDIAQRYVLNEARLSRLAHETNGEANRNQFMGLVDYLLSSESPLTDQRRLAARDALVRRLGRELGEAEGVEQRAVIQQLIDDVQNNDTAKYREHAPEGLNLRMIQDRQNLLDREASIMDTMTGLEEGRLNEASAMAEIQALYNHPSLGRDSMVNRVMGAEFTNEGGRNPYAAFKNRIETELLLLGRRNALRTGTEVLLSPEYEGLLARVGRGEDAARGQFQRIFGNEVSGLNPDFVRNVLIGLEGNAADTPLSGILNGWSNQGHEQKIRTIANLEREVSSLKTSGSADTDLIARCEQVLRDASTYKDFTVSVITRGLPRDRLNRLIRSSRHFRTLDVDARYQSILDFSRLFSDPDQTIASDLPRYAELFRSRNPDIAETVEIRRIQNNMRDLRNHIGHELYMQFINDQRRANRGNQDFNDALNSLALI